MNARRAAILLGITFALPYNTLNAQGFAGLGSKAEGFALPDTAAELSFPEDHGAHPEFRIEWWYITATLQDDSGVDLGVQWTLFRSALAPQDTQGWQSPQVWMGHAALTTPETHHFAERLARGGIGQAGVTTAPFEAWVDDWQMISPDDTLNTLSLRARGAEFSYDLSLTAQGPLVLHGQEGYSVKSQEGQASHYYSQPFYRVEGTVTQPEGTRQVTGEAWLDREWSSQPLAADQTGWDWFSLSFKGGAKLMGFVLRGEKSSFTSGTWISASGAATPLQPGAFQATPTGWSAVERRQIPTQWHVTLAEQNVDVTIEALNPDSWMGTSFSYWEGPVSIKGTHRGKGYLEMTGYSSDEAASSDIK